MSRIGALLCHDPVQPKHFTGAARDHRELRLKSLQVELTHDARVSLLHEKAPRARLHLFLYELELPLREPESSDVVRRCGIGVRKKDLGGGLLDDRAADRAFQDVTRTLGREAHDAV